ncbi:rod shape-determining protein MreD [Desulfuribacillus stibiiarsenatis]|uniref:Rod shape-determining protein MreD n=1 Tax=Desulfuribacillus stibiiarsenatis TaxID=1390249 RepID=A0A1E5L275_9FIRM|nr:rod shape-determining protein MreD [Desulfuribacillus stibiiarsenatis]OEH84235.1 rod shape-determining protein MreD [Desulfuribacillus stibiiarsenatis]
MYYLAIGGLMLLMVFIQSTVLSIVFPIFTATNSFSVPNLAIIVLTFICLFRNDKNIVYVAFIVGFLQDIVFGSYVGLYAFTYPFVAYWANITFRIFIDRHVVIFIVAVILAFFTFEFLVWGINSLFGLIEVSFMQAFDRYFWGSVLLGSALAAIIYSPIILFLQRRGIVIHE